MIIGSQYEGVRQGRKRGFRFLALAFSFCVLLAEYPNSSVTVYATEEGDTLLKDEAVKTEKTEVNKPETGVTDDGKESMSGNSTGSDVDVVTEDVPLSDQYNYSPQDSDTESPGAQTAPQSQGEAMWQAQANGEWRQGSLTEAVGGVYSGGVIVLLSDVSLTKGITIAKKVQITSYYSDRPCTIKNTAQDTNDNTNSGRIFTVTGSELILQNMILDGGRNDGVIAYHPLICVNGSTTLRIMNGVVLQNAENASQSICGGGVNVRRGVVYMYDGSEITRCKARHGGGVEINSNTAYTAAAFAMGGGSIEECEADNGGGVYVNIGRFQMQGGTITGNRATMANTGGNHGSIGDDNGGGGIYVKGTGQNTMAQVVVLGGSVTGNAAKGSGGGVLVCGTAAQLAVSDGAFQGNSARNGGGIAVLQGTLLLYGGTVTANTAESYGGGVLGCPYGRIHLQGEPVVYGNTAENRSDLFENLYLDGNEDVNPAWTTYPITLMGPLGENARIGLSRWIRPDAGGHPYREMFVPYNGYTIQQSDLDKLNIDGKLYADNMEQYAFIPYEGRIVMVLAVGVGLDRDRLSFSEEGKTAALTATVTPANALIKDVIWHSSDESVATVNSDGIVTAVSEGSAVITVKTVSPYSPTASCKVTVGKTDEPEEGEDKPSDPNPPGDPDKPEGEESTPGAEKKERDKKEKDKKSDENSEGGTDTINAESSYVRMEENTAGQKTLSEREEPSAENPRTEQELRITQNSQNTQNPRTGSYIVWLYASAALSGSCILMFIFLQIRGKKRRREKK